MMRSLISYYISSRTITIYQCMLQIGMVTIHRQHVSVGTCIAFLPCISIRAHAHRVNYAYHSHRSQHSNDKSKWPILKWHMTYSQKCHLYAVKIHCWEGHYGEISSHIMIFISLAFSKKFQDVFFH